MIATMLAVSTAAVLDACQGSGVDPDEMLADVGLAREVVRDPSARIAVTSAAALWRMAYTRTNDPALAIHAAEHLRFGAYRVLDHLATAAPTIGVAFERLAAHFSLINPAVSTAFERDPRGVWLRLSLPAVMSPAYLEYTLASFYLRIRAATTLPFAPIAVELAALPPRRHRDEYARVFERAPTVTRTRSGILISHDAWQATNPRGNPDLFAVLDDHAQLLARRRTATSYVEEVRSVIRDGLPHHELSLAAVARRLATSTRTLQRHLELEGLRYDQLVQTTQLAEARMQLTDRRLSVSDVARRLGFTQPSSFTRAFRRWTGQSPQKYRRTRR
jgi:AraC-like DNA-binding protein